MGVGWGLSYQGKGLWGNSGFTLLPTPFADLSLSEREKVGNEEKGKFAREQDPPAFGALGNKESDSSPNLKGEWVGGTNK